MDLPRRHRLTRIDAAVTVVVLALIGVLVVAGVRIVADARSAMADEVQRAQRTDAQQRAAGLGELLRVKLDNVETEAMQPLAVAAVAQRNRTLLQTYVDAVRAPGVLGTSIVDADGVTLASSGRPVPAAAGPITFVDRTVVVGAEIHDDSGAVVGRARQLVNIPDIAPTVIAPSSTAGSAVSLVRRDGTILITSVTNAAPRVTSAIVRAALSEGQSTTLRFRSSTLRKDRLAAVSPVQGTDVMVVVGSDASAANAAAHRLVWRILGVIAVAFVLALGLAIAATWLLAVGRRRLVARHAEAARLAETDPLTGVPNRRAFDRAVEAVITTSGTTSVVALDLDNLKTLNDRHGHPAGDDTLRLVAAAMRSVLRPRDLFARVGGDEFIALLPDTAPLVAHDVAGRMQASAGNVVTASGATASVSSGVATGPNAEIMATITEADLRLYEAKRARVS